MDNGEEIGAFDLRVVAFVAEPALEGGFQGLQLGFQVVAAEQNLQGGRPVAGDALDDVMEQSRVGVPGGDEAGDEDAVFRHGIERLRGAAPSGLVGEGTGDVLHGQAGGVGVRQVERETGRRDDGGATAGAGEEVELHGRVAVGELLRGGGGGLVEWPSMRGWARLGQCIERALRDARPLQI